MGMVPKPQVDVWNESIACCWGVEALLLLNNADWQQVLFMHL